MKLYIENNQTIPAGQLLQDTDIAPAGYTLSMTAINFEKFLYLFKNFNDMRNQMIASLLPNYGTATDDNKKAMVRNFVYPTTETIANLDLLYSQTERDSFKIETMKKLNADSENLFSVWKDSIDGNYYKAITQNGTTLTTLINTNNVL